MCDTEKVYLPARDQAENLGFGVWLITSATDAYTLTEEIVSGGKTTMKKYKGCRICILTLQCGHQLSGKNFKVRSDLTSCQHIPAVKVNVKLTDPLCHLIVVLSTVDEIPTYNPQVDVSIDILRSVREKLKIPPSSGDQESVEEIGRPIVSEMRQLKPTIVR